MGNSIICVEQYGSVTFTADKLNYPTYVIESIYNTDPNYDYGLLTKLKTKLLTAKLTISEFVLTFTDVGQVYVFGDSANPLSSQTIVKVVESKDAECDGQGRWPATATNLNDLGIGPNYRQMNNLSGWTYMISPLFVAGAFGLLFW
jgi:hypothetical protein